MERKDYIVALDLGSSGVKLALGTVDSQGQLSIVDLVSKSTEDGVSRGEITNRKIVGEALKSAVEQLETQNHIRISDLHTGVSDKSIKCANHDYYVFVGQRSDGEIRKEDVLALHDGMNNVQAEDGVRILERIPQVYRVDGRSEVKDPVGRFGKKLASTFTFVLGSSPMIERYTRTLDGLGLHTSSLTAGPMFAFEAVTTQEERDLGVVVLDIGAGTTDMCICKDGIVRYVRTIPLGGEDINHDIAEFGIPDKFVERLKVNHCQAFADEIITDELISCSRARKAPSISRKTLTKIAECRLLDITACVAKEITDSGYEGCLAGGMVITGGCANLKNIDKLFEKQFNCDVRVAQPDEFLSAESAKYAECQNATLIGMMLRAAHAGMFNRVEVIPSIGLGGTVQSRPQSEPVQQSIAVPRPTVTPARPEPRPSTPQFTAPKPVTPVVAAEPKAVEPQRAAADFVGPRNDIVESVKEKIDHSDTASQEPEEQPSNHEKGGLLKRFIKFMFPEDVAEDDDI